jgi:RNA polymerase sigma factor (sigma-70 family)
MMSQLEQEQRFKQIIDQHKGILFKVARSYCLDSNDQQDLVQEILIQIWQSLPKYNQHFAITTWIYRISLNVAISHYRKDKTREKHFIELSNQWTSLSLFENSETEHRLNLLEQFISELKELDKAVMLLYLEDKSQAEIADILGMSVSNVSTKVGRIKEQLRQRFNIKN